MTETIRYVDSANTGIILREVESSVIPRRGDRIVIDNKLITQVRATELKIQDEEVSVVVKVQIDENDSDLTALPEKHPNHVKTTKDEKKMMDEEEEENEETKETEDSEEE